MRTKIVAGNWKMNNDLSASINLISEIKNSSIGKNFKTKIILCPPFTSLETANALLKGTKISLGAQNMYYEENGAYTGEISAKMLKSVGCEFVIIGHSERRTIFEESDEIINLKLKAALKNNLKPIFCIGETLEEREKDKTFDVIRRQVIDGLKDLSESEIQNIIFAYEPVWAIGTGKNATPYQAQEVHKFIRDLLQKEYSTYLSDNIIIQYGGSVKPDNASELMAQPDIDGALVGGACLRSDSFIKIVESAE
jgi:triosephosphate isomerase